MNKQIIHDLQLWEPADLEKLEEWLPKAGVKLRESKFALKTEEPLKCRQYLLGVWSRKQKNPDVAALYQSKLLIEKAMLFAWVKNNPDLKLPVTFDGWYTTVDFCRWVFRNSRGEHLFAIIFVHLITLTLGGMGYLIKFPDHTVKSQRAIKFLCRGRIKKNGKRYDTLAARLGLWSSLWD